MSTAMTAKVYVSQTNPAWNDSTALVFLPDYADGANKAWAESTPSLEFRMVVRSDVAAGIEMGTKYDVLLTPRVPEASAAVTA